MRGVGTSLGQVTESLVLIGHDGPSTSVDDLLTEFDAEVVGVRPMSDAYRWAHVKSNVISFGDFPTLSLNQPAVFGWRGLLKRAADVALSGLALIVLSPLLALIAVGIRLSSNGTALFFQTRVTRDGKLFRLVKFRTMRDDAERDTGPVWARNHDPRCTTIGRILRRTSLDELPQLWNVLKGEMSLVGPRPERPVFVDEFATEMPTYMLRHTVKAGLTGWAQVNGWRGNTSILTRLEHDLHYIQHWSVLFDAKILWRTVAGGFRNKNAY